MAEYNSIQSRPFSAYTILGSIVGASVVPIITSETNNFGRRPYRRLAVICHHIHRPLHKMVVIVANDKNILSKIGQITIDNLDPEMAQVLAGIGRFQIGGVSDVKKHQDPILVTLLFSEDPNLQAQVRVEQGEEWTHDQD